MTKISIRWASLPEPESAPALKALDALPPTALVAYHLQENLLFVRDDYVDSTLSYLAQAGIAGEIVKLERIGGAFRKPGYRR